jgi:cysteine synthase A
MPEGMSDERTRLIAAYGARLDFTPGGESDVDLSLERLEEIRSGDPDRYYVPAQFSNRDNISAHEETTGPEIWEQTGGAVDAFVASQGTGGCLTGVGRFLRAQHDTIQLWAVEPEECSILADGQWGPHGIEGIGDGFVPENLDCGPLTGVVTTTTDESLEMARRLAREEGIFCGISTGCNVAAALRVLEAHPELRCVVTMACDTGQRYFSTPLCGGEKGLEVPERGHDLDPRSRSELARHRPSWEILRP